MAQPLKWTAAQLSRMPTRRQSLVYFNQMPPHMQSVYLGSEDEIERRGLELLLLMQKNIKFLETVFPKADWVKTLLSRSDELLGIGCKEVLKFVVPLFKSLEEDIEAKNWAIYEKADFANFEQTGMTIEKARGLLKILKEQDEDTLEKFWDGVQEALDCCKDMVNEKFVTLEKDETWIDRVEPMEARERVRKYLEEKKKQTYVQVNTNISASKTDEKKATSVSKQKDSQSSKDSKQDSKVQTKSTTPASHPTSSKPPSHPTTNKAVPAKAASAASPASAAAAGVAAAGAASASKKPSQGTKKK